MLNRARCGRGTRVLLVAIAMACALVSASAVPSWAKELMLRIGDLRVPDGTAVRGDVIAVGGTAYVDGVVEGDAVAIGGNVDVRGHVTGSVRAEGGSVVLHSTAVVDGDAVAVGGSVLREAGASVGGRSAPSAPAPPSAPPPGGEEQAPPPWWLPGLLWGMLLMLKSLFWFMHLFLLALFIGSAWMLAVLFPRVTARLGAVLERDPVVTLAAGLLGWPIAFMLAVLLIISVVGIPLVLLVPAVLFTAVQFGTTAVALIVGHRLRPSGTVEEVIVGAVILAVVFSIPGLGGLAALVVATWGLGATLMLFVEGRRARQSPPSPQPPSTPRPPGGTVVS